MTAEDPRSVGREITVRAVEAHALSIDCCDIPFPGRKTAMGIFKSIAAMLRRLRKYSHYPKLTLTRFRISPPLTVEREEGDTQGVPPFVCFETKFRRANKKNRLAFDAWPRLILRPLISAQEIGPSYCK